MNTYTIKLTKLMQISDNVVDRLLGVDYYSHAMYFGNDPNPLFSHLSHQGAAYLAASAGIRVTFAKGTEGYQEEQDAKAELLESGTYDLEGNER